MCLLHSYYIRRVPYCGVPISMDPGLVLQRCGEPFFKGVAIVLFYSEAQKPGPSLGPLVPGSCGRLVLWSLGPVVAWSSGPLVLWSLGPLVAWSSGPSVLWSLGPLVPWSSC